MENEIEEIKSKVDIVDFLGNFISLKKAGKNFKAPCPFHQEKTPSFIVSPERQIWHCFGACQEGGDVIKFLMKWENITFIEALRELAEKVGVKLKKITFEDKALKKKERIIALNTLSADFFEYVLNKTRFGQKARDYLRSRQISPRTAKKFQLGYAPQSWDSLLHFLLKKKYDRSEVYEAGLAVRGEKGSFYDRFRGRLVFPIRDARGNVIGFSGRALDNDNQGAKYINTPETPLYRKRETLYGIHLAREAIKKEKNVFFVEGEFDVISPYQAGFENFVAIKGSAVTREQLTLIKRYTDRITFALDADEAGIEAIKRGIEEARDSDLEIVVVSFAFAKDPDEAVRSDPVKFKKAVNKPLPIYDFLIEIFLKKYPSTDPYNKKKLGEELAPHVGKINNPIIRSHYIKKLASILDVSESSIEDLIRRIKNKKKKFEIIKTKKTTLNSLPREIVIQKYVLSLIFQSGQTSRMGDEVFKIIDPLDFSIVSYQKISRFFLKEQKADTGKFDLKSFSQKLPSELRPVFDETYLFASNELGFEGENIEKLSLEIKKNALKRKIGEILSAEGKDSDEAKEKLTLLGKALNEVEKTMIKL
jgi:DNA primase